MKTAEFLSHSLIEDEVSFAYVIKFESCMTESFFKVVKTLFTLYYITNWRRQIVLNLMIDSFHDNLKDLIDYNLIGLQYSELIIPVLMI